MNLLINGIFKSFIIRWNHLSILCDQNRKHIYFFVELIIHSIIHGTITGSLPRLFVSSVWLISKREHKKFHKKQYTYTFLSFFFLCHVLYIFVGSIYLLWRYMMSIFVLLYNTYTFTYLSTWFIFCVLYEIWIK
jgi:hypothetical protein